MGSIAETVEFTLEVLLEQVEKFCKTRKHESVTYGELRIILEEALKERRNR
jgi:hypothetical protein